MSVVPMTCKDKDSAYKNNCFDPLISLKTNTDSKLETMMGPTASNV
eukprot:CAMPEP_0194774564 /NCGR_PEP_ID=MMETSP0323_2-20130528/57993_1 /TAXON_ID=2866 ORGANISM="Crypthecodinium cohnii, Strain Seligo" /NCGR_SAMPLE_ID=MMETSP0323_2 /ASSEMBLY_ACC=CAM_ASM_000346 /LENGTH=45 /DNA_ID= /DNA_START= /DNA_END= /DNA_ORIENTATION=